MITDETLSRKAHKLIQLKAQANALKAEISKLNDDVLAEVTERGGETTVGNLLLKLKITPDSLIVDTEAIKAAGLFEKYSKPKKGSTSLIIKASH